MLRIFKATTFVSSSLRLIGSWQTHSFVSSYILLFFCSDAAVEPMNLNINKAIYEYLVIDI